jgi:mannose-6-phosphate isomerase class I
MQTSKGEIHAHTAPGIYDLFPAYPVQEGQIQSGFDAIADVIGTAIQRGLRHIAIDGFGGVLWQVFQGGLDDALRRRWGAHQITWRDTSAYFLSESALMAHIAPNLGGDDPIFGKLHDGDITGFFDPDKLQALDRTPNDTPRIIFGVGAALIGTPDMLIYVDVPKDEIQNRMKAKIVTNLGAAEPSDAQAMYKRFYFVDWPALNRHKARLIPAVDWFVDAQQAESPSIIAGDQLRTALGHMAHTCFRARPWFAPGPWGGQWMKAHFPGLDRRAPNYAWSFELIVPENGLVLESGDERLECSFDLLMFLNHQDVLGRAAGWFGYNFPIRFDYLDTFDGSDLSVQCHPRPEYIRQQFGEPFTQDESYYITTCKPGAQVNLGFLDGVDPAAFRREVERSEREGAPIDIDRFVNSVEAHPHDLFLIPNGTIHGSGVNNLVLEISATPYIYTFKIYDWMRRDLEGKLRPLNIERAWDNLYFERQETYVREQLCARPTTLREGDGWREVFVGTHDAIFYAVHRYEFTRNIAAQTQGRCHILNVVEGDAVIVETANGYQAQFYYAETFIIPAAAESYRLIAVGTRPCKVVMAFVK